ncbi:MAG: hypothetical protein P8I99_02655 [Acidimicrobiales bacterium]|nr:hypothetical protein [Acidimicrobiales bacterium]MDG1876296.1 hypothetical protein [Acidimicrobiales bacterium]
METMPVLEQLTARCKQAVAGDRAREDISAVMNALFEDPATLAATIPRFRDDEVATSPRGFRLGGEHICYQSSDLTVMVLDTLPGVLQPPHDHNMVALIGVFEGCEEQRFWARAEGGITPAAGRMLEAGEVVVLGERAIHAISAPAHTPARAIHVYLGNIDGVDRSVFDPDTLEEHPMSSERYDGYCRPA